MKKKFSVMGQPYLCEHSVRVGSLVRVSYGRDSPEGLVAIKQIAD